MNLICLTQPNEVDSSLISIMQKRESVVSNDYQSSFYHGIDRTSNDDSISPKLSEYQSNALTECIGRINWLLKDEITSIALDSYPICESTLEMVITHIENSQLSAFSFKKQVQLQFVFGSTANNTTNDISLNRFCDSMGQIKLPGFQLKREGKYYYISYDKESKDPSNGTELLVSSFIPALSSNPSFHFNDKANLHQICSKTISNDSPSDAFDNNRNREILFSTPLTLNKSKSMKEKGNENLSDDSFEDNETGLKRKRHLNRKHHKCRSASVPPNSTNEVKEIQRKPGQSLPEADFEFIKTLKQEIKSKANEEIIENERESFINSSVKLSENTFMNASDKLDIDLSNCSEIETAQTSPKVQNKKLKVQNNEDLGYDGDSDSDSDIESLNWLSLDCKQPIAPKFWLIMKINSDSVMLYFHTRPKNTSSESYIKGIEIFNHVVGLVESICKTVNQMLLLESLHDTRMCDDLLVSIEDNDPWNKTSRRTALSRSQLTQSIDLETDSDLINSKSSLKLMKTNVTFSSGLFSCGIVWRKHFPLHPRLLSGPSRGILAMRTVLNSFSVNNRKNLFVYQESSGSVFYLRLDFRVCLIQ